MILHEGYQPDLEALGDRVSCTYMQAPMDYQAPDKGDVSIALLRIRAAQPDVRTGSIFTNPGGPGGDGLGMAISLARTFDQGNPQSVEVGTLNKRVKPTM